MRKKTVFWPALASIFLLASSAEASLERYVFEASSGAVLEIAARAFQPGEPVLISLRSSGDLIRVKIEFLNEVLILEPGGGGPTIGCLGIDLDARPGPHPIALMLTKKTGRHEESLREFEIHDRIFPETRLTVSPRYVQPPPENRERIRRERDLIAWIYGIHTSRWLGDGNFVLPHQGPNWANFGQRRILNDVLNSVHNGLDIRAPHGDLVRASNSGRIVMASDLYMSGKSVIIDHGLGIFSFYCHLSHLLVRRGQPIAKGEPIGRIGSTGRSTGPHLHWSFKVPGGRVDPEAMLELPFPQSIR